MRFLALFLALAALCRAETYNEDFAKYATHLAAAAYCPAADLIGWNGTCTQCKNVPGFQTAGVAQDDPTGTQAFVGFDPAANEVVVSFRGSADFIDWIEDFETWKVDADFDGCSGCKVHAGFYEAHNSIKATVLKFVQSEVAAHPGASVLVTGHSLGASMAVLSVAELAANAKINVTHCYTMGQPRVGDKAFHDWYDGIIMPDNHFRLVHHHDIVPTLPPQFFGFEHTHTEIWYDEASSSYVICDGSGEDPKCSDSNIDLSADDHTYYLNITMGC